MIWLVKKSHLVLKFVTFGFNDYKNTLTGKMILVTGI